VGAALAHAKGPAVADVRTEAAAAK